MSPSAELAWSRFYDQLERNAQAIEDVLATGLSLETIHWDEVPPPPLPRPVSLEDRHVRVIDRVTAVTVATEEAMVAVEQSLHDLPHNRPDYSGSHPMGGSLDVFG